MAVSSLRAISAVAALLVVYWQSLMSFRPVLGINFYSVVASVSTSLLLYRVTMTENGLERSLDLELLIEL